MVVLTLLVGMAGWRVAQRVGLAAPAMLGSMLAVGISNVLFGYAVVPEAVRIFAQGISGAFIAMSITPADLFHARRLIVPLVLLLACFTLNTIVVGLFIHAFCDIDLMTALFSCVAGGVTDTALIAMDFGADAGEVGLMQTARLVTVLLFFPYWIKFMCRNCEDGRKDDEEACAHGSERAANWFSKIVHTHRGKVIFTVAVSVACAAIGQASGVPAASMVFPLVVVAALNLSASACSLPLSIKNVAQLLAGSLVGASITAKTFASIESTLVPVVMLVVSYWLVNCFYAFACSRLHLLDLKSALFVSSPGGATDMALIAADLHADLTKIAVLQVLRAVYAVAVMPGVVMVITNLLQ